MITIGDKMKPCPVCHGARVVGEEGLTFPGRTCVACAGQGEVAQVVLDREEPTS